MSRRVLAGWALLLAAARLAHSDAAAANDPPPPAQAKDPGPCRSAEANDLLLRGRKEWPPFGPRTPAVTAAAGKALAYYELAVEKDAQCAQAQVALAQAYATFPSWPALQERNPKVRAAAARAIEVDERLPAAHLLLAGAEFGLWNWEVAEKEYKRAIELDPKAASSRLAYARFLAAMGRSERAQVETEGALELDPGSQDVRVRAGDIYYWLRRYDRSIELLRPAAESNPAGPLWLLGWAYVGKRMWPEAIRAFEEHLPLSDRDAGALMSLAYAYAAAGRREDAARLLPEVKRKAELMFVPAYRVAATYLALGDKEQAYEWLEKAYRDNPGWMVWLKVDPVMDPLRSEPRFQDLLRRLRFPSE